MNKFLEQGEVDRLIQLQVELAEKQNKAKTAKEKIKEMFIHEMGYPCFEEMNTLTSIGKVIEELSTGINRDSQYFISFMMLKQSYQNKIFGI